MKNTSFPAPVDTQPKLVDPHYFEKFVTRFEACGYKLFSQVSLDTNDCAYAEPVAYARETALFYHMPHKKIIVQFVFVEHCNQDCTELAQYWKVRVCSVFKSVENLLRELQEYGRRSGSVDQLQEYKNGLEIPGFLRNSENEYGQKRSYLAPINSETFATLVAQALDPILSYLASGKFHQLLVDDFCPHKTFPGCHEIFWSRFDREALKKIVDNLHCSFAIL